MAFRTPSGSTSDCSLVWKKEKKNREDYKQGSSGHVDTNLDSLETAYCCYLSSFGRGLKPLWRTVSKQCGFAVRIHWFRVEGRPIRVKKSMRQQKYPDRVDAASGTTDAEIENMTFAL